jgi:hypothetical protein
LALTETLFRRPLALVTGIALVSLLPAYGAWANPAVDAQIADLARGRVSSLPTQVPFAPIDRAWIERVYPPARSDPVWFLSERALPAIDVALRELRTAADRRLAPEDYDVASLERLVQAAKGDVVGTDAIARADVALTATILQFVSDQLPCNLRVFVGRHSKVHCHCADSGALDADGLDLDQPQR